MEASDIASARDLIQDADHVIIVISLVIGYRTGFRIIREIIPGYVYDYGIRIDDEQVFEPFYTFIQALEHLLDLVHLVING